jgi:hypothetical protein
VAAGVYANNASVWFSPYEFTLDWSIAEPLAAENPEDPESSLIAANLVVARVRIPVGLIFDVMRGLNEAMSRYERLWGEIKGPRPHGQENDEGPDINGNQT